MKNKIRISAAWLMLGILLFTAVCTPVYAKSIDRVETPDYTVAFYAFDCYHMQDENGNKTGYGYEMMQGLSRYLQCTFSYTGYDRTAAECIDMLRNGEIDIYTAAKWTEERAEEFVYSKHPAITATTCMNIKVGNNKVIAGDYSTYDGLRIGLLERHTYNDKFLAFVKEKGFSCDIRYYDTPTELSSALISGEVDALVDSYIGVPEDEQIIENFGQTPYYIIARKEDQALITELDEAFDQMNLETPNWRTELYNKYYGSQSKSTELTEEERAFLKQMKENDVVVRGVMNPDENPYSWYEDGEAYGISADIFRATAEELGLSCDIMPVSTRKEYEQVLKEGNTDIWIDMDDDFEGSGDARYKETDSYLTTTVSVLRNRGASEKIRKLAVVDGNISLNKTIPAVWPDVEILNLNDNAQCVEAIISGEADGALMLSYTAQKLARDDLQNRLRVDIVPDVEISIRMGVNASDSYLFYGIWEKTLENVAERMGTEVVQAYLEETATPTALQYLFDHPVSLVMIAGGLILMVFLLLLYLQMTRSRNRQRKISDELAAALEEARKANESKQNFFSKMSHDIRTPLNVVLGMTQIAQKYKYDVPRLERALDSITTEGNYLLVLINSILDVNQLEHGYIELVKEPFNPAENVKNSVEMLKPLAEKKDQQITVTCDREDCVVIGDANRYSQIMINIISNAIKYTGTGGHIEVALQCLPEGRYRFTCRDDGIGMTEEFVQHICEDYTRAEDSRISKTQGTGLGMSVVKGLTDLMQGTLQIESRLNEGTTFTVEIPFPDATQEQRMAVLEPGTDEENGVSEFSGKKILLVEDNSLNAEIATELLQSIGLTVDWAENGEVGVTRYNESEPGEYFAIFMDMQMPVMDGLEATRVIRRSDRSDRDIPIFAMTANTFASDRKSCRDVGMNGYISKPINVKDIEMTLKDGVSA